MRLLQALGMKANGPQTHGTAMAGSACQTATGPRVNGRMAISRLGSVPTATPVLRARPPGPGTSMRVVWRCG
jgi:hypothetical protein